MKKKILSDTLLQIFRTRKRFVFGILISLILETVISLGLPGILSKIIDGLGKQTVTWLVAFILFFLAIKRICNSFKFLFKRKDGQKRMR